jgi:hypothetical protein
LAIMMAEMLLADLSGSRVELSFVSL